MDACSTKERYLKSSKRIRYVACKDPIAIKQIAPTSDHPSSPEATLQPDFLVITYISKYTPSCQEGEREREFLFILLTSFFDHFPESEWRISIVLVTSSVDHFPHHHKYTERRGIAKEMLSDNMHAIYLYDLGKIFSSHAQVQKTTYPLLPKQTGRIISVHASTMFSIV